MQLTNRTTAGAIIALGSLTILAIPSPAAAWDELCGPDEAHARVCEPGEVSHGGTIPVPLPAPLPVLPPPVVLAPLVTTPGTPDALQPAALSIRYTCAELVARHAGPNSLRDRGCAKPPVELTCRVLYRRHAGVRWLVAYRCDTARGRRAFRHVAVAG